MNFSSNLPDALTNAVLACISRSDYHVEPPKLSADLWDRVCILTSESKAENERLEFLGDALMDACFALEMYKQIPHGTPHMYTVSSQRTSSRPIVSHSYAEEPAIGDPLRTPSEPGVLPSCE